MTILVIGSTGTIGRQIVAGLAQKGADVHALVRDSSKANFTDGVTIVKGDLMDVEAMRSALSTVSTLFLLNAVSPDEVTQALITLNLAREAGIERIVYLSVIHSDLYTNVPHFAAKYTVERMIEQFDIHATILRPAYFMDNETSLRTPLLEYGVYPMPVGSLGLSMVDSRDIVDVAVAELLRREQSATPLPRQIITVVGPECLTGETIASIWSEALRRPVSYGGDDINSFEETMKAFAPGWMAYDMRLMAERFQSDGMIARKDDISRLEELLDRPLLSYREFAFQTAAAWKLA